MATECFCGCGVEVPLGRRRAANAVGAQFDEQLRVLRGALERGADPGRLAELVASGEALRDGLRGIVHGTIDRNDYDKSASRAWMKRALEERGRLAEEVAGQDYAGWNTLEQSELVHAGSRAPGVVIEVKDTGTTVNNQPRVRLRLRVQPEGEPPFEIERKLLVSRLAIPRAGERVEVAYDPDDRDRFTFRVAVLADTPSRLDELAKLAELRSSGVLTEAEFEAEKRRILTGE
jgi:putative oligomerization/nucleic acid binding protein